MTDLEKKFSEISKEEVLKRVAALEFDHFLKYYENAEDLNARADFKERRNENTRRDNERRERPTYERDGGFTKLFINLGTKDGFYKASFLQFILDESNLKKEVLGRIDLREMNAWVEVDKSAAAKMIKSLDGKSHNGRQVRMNEADGGGGNRRPLRENRKRIPMRERR
jgi:ATP-dependent RNA helicase DeaD